MAKKQPPLIEVFPAVLDTPEFKEIWEGYVDHRKSMKKPMTPFAKKLILKKLCKWGLTKAIQALENSITGHWTDVYEPKQEQNGTSARTPEPGAL